MVILRVDPDGRTYVKFGNNSTGMVPASGSTVRIEYISNDGLQGNIENSNANITLDTPVYFENQTKMEMLQVSINSDSVAAGGANTQSLQLLKESSPYVFASGNRAVRRNDYKALLLNKCGYSSCNVWGEYEQTQYYGYYTPLMMNMVYYTGIRTIQNYDFKQIGSLMVEKNITKDTPATFNDYIGPMKGFMGSYEINLVYSKDNNTSIKYTDKFGNGILTYDASSNPNDKDYALYPYNDLLDDWDSDTSRYIAKVSNTNKGTGYHIGSTVTATVGEQTFTMKVTELENNTTSVKNLSLISPLSGKTKIPTQVINTVTTQGSGCKLDIDYKYQYFKPVIKEGGTGYAIGDTVTININKTEISYTVLAGNLNTKAVTDLSEPSLTMGTLPVHGTDVATTTNGSGSGCKLDVDDKINYFLQITDGGRGYIVDDELSYTYIDNLGVTLNKLTFSVDGVDNNNAVTAISLKDVTDANQPVSKNNVDTVFQQGTGLKVELSSTDIEEHHGIIVDIVNNDRSTLSTTGNSTFTRKIRGDKIGIDNFIKGQNSGLYVEGYDSLEGNDTEFKYTINYEEPLQIAIVFPRGTTQSIAGFMFQSPELESQLKYYMGKFCVFGTQNPDARYSNVRTDSNWVPLMDMHEMEFGEETNQWSDWYTTNLYQPEKLGEINDGWQSYNKYLIEIYSHYGDTEEYVGEPLSIQNMKVILMRKYTSIQIRQ